MEMLIIVCSSTMQEAFFEKAGISSYTRIPEVVGAGRGGGTRLNDEIWPGVNSLYLVCLPTEPAAALKTWAREYRRDENREGFKVFSLAVQEII